MYGSASAIGAGYWFASVSEMDASGSENGHRNLIATVERRVGSLNRSSDEVARMRDSRHRKETTADKRWGTGSARQMQSEDGRHESGNVVRRRMMPVESFLMELDGQNLRRPTDWEDRGWTDTWDGADRTLGIFTYRSDEI